MILKQDIAIPEDSVLIEIYGKAAITRIESVKTHKAKEAAVNRIMALNKLQDSVGLDASETNEVLKLAKVIQGANRKIRKNGWYVRFVY